MYKKVVFGKEDPEQEARDVEKKREQKPVIITIGCCLVITINLIFRGWKCF